MLLMLFAGPCCCCPKGWKTFQGKFYTIEACKKFIDETPYEGGLPKFMWAHIVDGEKIIVEGEWPRFYMKDGKMLWKEVWNE